MRFLFVDQILDSKSGAWIKGVKHVSVDDPWLTRDADGAACMIPSLVGETLGQLAAWNVMHSNQFTARPVAGVVASCRPLRPVYAGETLLLESVIEQLDDAAVQYHSTAYVGKECVFQIEGALGPLLPMQDFIDPQTVRQQFDEINRPDDWHSYESLPGIEQKMQLPAHRDMMPLFDHIIQSTPGESITAIKKISRLAPWFADHFPLKPVLPMTILIASICKLAEQFVLDSGMDKPILKEIRRIKMNDFVQPGAVLTAHLKVKSHDEQGMVLQSRTESDGKRVCVLELNFSNN